MNINKTNQLEQNSINTNFKARLIIDAKLAKKLPGIENFRKVAENIKSADFIRIRKSMNDRYLPRHDMYMVITEKVANLNPTSTSPYTKKHFIGTHSTLINKNASSDNVEVEIMELLNISLDNLNKKVTAFKEKNPGVIRENTGFFQNITEKIKSFLKR